ncbi:hypothetical protein BHM03_00016581 [Ensete ventricosum]|uniref:Uncharacterized protein n=2 Tax=Ensete ventricosum TaxID=4639 RepID=A0A445MEX5_ENSVE|nr:hypothetical protein BHM03_00016581 [Ensete ventricosum]
MQFVKKLKSDEKLNASFQSLSLEPTSPPPESNPFTQTANDSVEQAKASANLRVLNTEIQVLADVRGEAAGEVHKPVIDDAGKQRGRALAAAAPVGVVIVILAPPEGQLTEDGRKREDDGKECDAGGRSRPPAGPCGRHRAICATGGVRWDGWRVKWWVATVILGPSHDECEGTPMRLSARRKEVA